MNETHYNNDNLASWWNAGILIAYAFLVFFFVWVGYRIILISNAYMAGDLGFIRAELIGYAIFCTAYFGIGGLLRYSRII
jgi:hypothetical protein